MPQYQTNVSDKEWEILSPYFAPSKLGRPRKHNIRDVINAIRYLMKTACQSRFLPNDFANHKVVYDYYMRSKHKSKIQKIHDSLVWKVRISSKEKFKSYYWYNWSPICSPTSIGDERGYDVPKKLKEGSVI